MTEKLWRIVAVDKPILGHFWFNAGNGLPMYSGEGVSWRWHKRRFTVFSDEQMSTCPWNTLYRGEPNWKWEEIERIPLYDDDVYQR